MPIENNTTALTGLFFKRSAMIRSTEVEILLMLNLYKKRSYNIVI